MSRGARPRLVSQPESQAMRVLEELADEPMSKAHLSGKLAQKQLSGHLNKESRLPVADGSVGFTVPEKPRSRHQVWLAALV